MKLNSFSMPYSIKESRDNEVAAPQSNFHSAAKFFDTPTRLAGSSDRLVPAYSTALSPGQISARVASVMSYDRSKSFPHSQVTIEAWAESVCA
ncbi:MAG: hypothetical protein H7315_17630 [Herminiimonas sp.]|nr:hypothetical protein [Herminiimonas sp.]